MSSDRKPLYGPEELAGFDPARQLGEPGRFPFTRGIHPTMYRGRLWTMRQFSGFGTAEDTNRRYKFLLEHGQTGLSVAFDFPTLMGYDSDHPRAEGEVGKRLDFILQEMNREANTILSKSSDLAISDAAIVIKTEVEKLREQAQNVE